MKKPLLTTLAAEEAAEGLNFIDHRVTQAIHYLEMNHVEPHETLSTDDLLKTIASVKSMLSGATDSIEKTKQWLEAIKE